VQTENGFVVAGRSYSNDGYVTGHYGASDYWVVKMDTSGNFDWQRSLGGTNADEALSLVETIDSGFVIAGNSASNNDDVSGNHGNGDFWIIKLLNPHCQIYYYDGDGDGFGSALVMDTFCNGVPSGWVSNNLDCDDANAAVNPSATEICNNIDDNCNGQIDEGVGFVFYLDNDGDGYGDVNSSIFTCFQPYGYVTDSTDCNDVKVDIHPGAPEICNSIDDNCNGQIDEGLPSTIYFQDADGDGYGNPLVTVSACAGAPVGYVSDSTDCDDTNPNVNPGELEIPGNGIDDNCNGQIDEFGTGIHAATTLTNFSIYPNPAHDQTTIYFTLPASSHLYIVVYDVDGKEIETLLNEEVAQGDHTLSLNTGKFSKGVYMVKVIGDFVATNTKLIVQ
jgi:hypothetical protein